VCRKGIALCTAAAAAAAAAAATCQTRNSCPARSVAYDCVLLSRVAEQAS